MLMLLWARGICLIRDCSCCAWPSHPLPFWFFVASPLPSHVFTGGFACESLEFISAGSCCRFSCSAVFQSWQLGTELLVKRCFHACRFLYIAPRGDGPSSFLASPWKTIWLGSTWFSDWSPQVQKSKIAKACKSCRSRQELSNAYFLATFGFDTAENEPLKVC